MGGSAPTRRFDKAVGYLGESFNIETTHCREFMFFDFL